MTTTDQTELDAAFALLCEVVEEHHRQGRRCFSAGLKPAMQKRAPGFFEGRLGFTSFRQFLEAGAARRIVELQGTHGPDVNVVPLGASPLPSGGERADHPRSPRWVRPDLWRAFFDWTPGLKRVFDRRGDRALVFSEAPNPLEAPDVTAMRSEVEADPDQFIEIKPIGMDSQMVWMNDYANGVKDDALRQALHAALMTDRPIAAFNRVVRAEPTIGREWYARRLHEVESVMAEWQEFHGLRLALNVPRDDTERPMAPTEAGTGAGTEVDDLRARLHAAIDRMPMPELLKLVEYLIDRR